MEKPKMFLLDKLSIALLALNLLGVIGFVLPPGRAYYMPEFLVALTIILFAYCMFGFSMSGVLGVILNIAAIVQKRKRKMKVWLNVVFLILFVPAIPLGWLFHQAAMSV